jgi:hypothetical protein
MKKKFWYRPLVIVGLLLAVLAFAGCSGDDGNDGKDGQPGISSYQAAVDAGYIDPNVISEEEFYQGLAAASEEALAPLYPPEESCNV